MPIFSQFDFPIIVDLETSLKAGVVSLEVCGYAWSTFYRKVFTLIDIRRFPGNLYQVEVAQMVTISSSLGHRGYFFLFLG